jgi:CheY-like chemotaxis protein
VSETISAVASLLWPLIVLAVLVLFRGPLTRVIRSTEKRDFTIRIAGQEVSVGELHRQQMDMMADLHDQVAALRKDVDVLRHAGPAKLTGPVRKPAESRAVSQLTGAEPSTATPPVAGGASSNGVAAFEDSDNDTELTDVDVPDQTRRQFHDDLVKAPWERLELATEESAEPDTEAQSTKTGTVTALPEVNPTPGAAGADAQHTTDVPQPDTRPKAAGVLWVDDHPEHNALQLDQLERRGIVVDAARSTREALQKLTGQRYQLIVSDMERVEGGKPVPNAGLELIRTVRTFDRDTPVVIYSAAPSERIMDDTAARIGADLVTNSWYELSQELHRVGVL